METIRSVFILPEHQGAGVGLALMQHLEQLATQSGVVEQAVPSSITAEGFYLKLGYLNVREEHEGAKKNPHHA